jgi:hypothetical protein
LVYVKQGLGPDQIFDNMAKTGNWSPGLPVRTLNGMKLHTDAVAQNGYLVHADPLQKIAASTFVEFGGVTSEARLVAKERIVAAIKADKKTFDTLKQAYASGLEIIDTAGKRRLKPVFLTSFLQRSRSTVVPTRRTNSCKQCSRVDWQHTRY